MVESQMPKIQSQTDATDWLERHGNAAPKVGDLAPDFALADVNGEQTVSLSAFRDTRPVALVFGSFT